jgi:hypothetical protein
MYAAIHKFYADFPNSYFVSELAEIRELRPFEHPYIEDLIMSESLNRYVIIRKLIKNDLINTASPRQYISLNNDIVMLEDDESARVWYLLNY